jgi:lipopolysaccharide export system permease protein
MRLLDRYLFRELLTPLAFCLGGILILGVCGTLFNQLDVLQERKLHLLDIIEYSLAITPEFLVTALPVILLLALLYALTNHARANEITAMRAAGVSLWRVSVPYFAVGIAASLALFVLNEIVSPRSTDWANRILTRYVEKSGDTERLKPFQGFASGHRQWQFSEYRPDSSEMIRPIVFWKLKDGSSQQLHADSAVFTNGVWTFFNAAEYSQAGAQAPLVPLFQTNVTALAMPEFDETPAQIRSEIKISGYLSLGNLRNADVPLKDLLGYLRLHPNLPRATSGPLLTELHGRIAAPWTCLGVVFIAIPFGVASGRRNLFVGVAGSIAICFSYFVIQKISLAFGTGGSLPAWLAAWLPNLIFGATGLFLMTRVR